MTSALVQVKNNKAPGPGDLSIELIKYATTAAIEIVCDIFNKSLAGDNNWLENFIAYTPFMRKDVDIHAGITGE